MKGYLSLFTVTDFGGSSIHLTVFSTLSVSVWNTAKYVHNLCVAMETKNTF